MHLSPSPHGFGCCPFLDSGSLVVGSLFIAALLFVGFLCLILVLLYTALCSSCHAIILKGKRELGALL